MQDVPLTLPDCDKETDQRFRCRVFLKQCIRALDAAGIIRCSDANAVVNGQLRAYAEETATGILDRSGIYTINKSIFSS